MMRRGQIDLTGKGRESNARFLRSLHTSSDLEGMSKWFDAIETGSWQRTPDEHMTLEAFLQGIFSHTVLQLGSPDPGLIRYGCTSEIDDRECFAWVIAPFTHENYAAVERLFGEVYSETLESAAARDPLG